MPRLGRLVGSREYSAFLEEVVMTGRGKALLGEKTPTALNMDEVGPLPAIIDKAVLDRHPDFKGEWAQ
jgi:hypothetical protein